MTKKNPAVSVIIPMYNTEKYVGFCLESVLAQTFTDYEVIVVDDCSTDNSCAVVESYKSMFGGKLKLIRSKKNSGGCAVPRNIGVKNSSGKYLTFIDSDDFVTETTLADFYNVAEDFDADVVACEKYFALQGDNVECVSYIKRDFVTEPTLLADDLSTRVEGISQTGFFYNMCMKLIRKDFLSENKLEMLNIVGEDALMTWCMLCVAKKYVLTPSVNYFYRFNETSVTKKPKDIPQTFHTWLNAMTKGFKYLDSFLSKQEFFRRNPHLKFVILEALISDFNSYLLPYYLQVDTYELDAIVRKEFSRAGDEAALMAFLFSRMNLLSVQLIQAQEQIKQIQSADK